MEPHFHPRFPVLAPVLLVSLSLAVVACSPTHADDPRTQPPLVRVVSATSSTQATRAVTGVVVARVQSDLGFRVGGKLIERLVDAGQTVRRGQVLMRIDPTDLALATSAQANAVEAARARAVQTGADEKRLADLVSAGAVSVSAYDQAKAAADSARAMLSAAEAQASVARNLAGYSTLLADADGVVVETLGEPGQVVAAGQAVVRLARSGPREALVSLPETVRPQVGSMAVATVFGAGQAEGPATLRLLSDSANAQTRTFDARYVLQGAAAGAPIGSTVTIRFQTGLPDSRFDVPLGAVHDAGKGPGVWLVSADATPQVRWQKVDVASLSEDSASLAGGLKNGDRFVAVGAHLLHDGEAVRVEGAAEVAK